MQPGAAGAGSEDHTSNIETLLNLKLASKKDEDDEQRGRNGVGSVH